MPGQGKGGSQLKDYTICPQCKTIWQNEEMQQLRRKLAIKTDLHDIDGKALVKANKKIRDLEKELTMWKHAAKSWQKLAKKHERDKADLRKPKGT